MTEKPDIQPASAADSDLPTRKLISDERLLEATGRTRKQWFKALDKAGAQDWDHKRIARWLGGKHEVDGWWAQSVTVDYEYARGKRIHGQRADGSFETTASKSLRLPPGEIWPFIDDDDTRRETDDGIRVLRLDTTRRR